MSPWIASNVRVAPKHDGLGSRKLAFGVVFTEMEFRRAHRVKGELATNGKEDHSYEASFDGLCGGWRSTLGAAACTNTPAEDTNDSTVVVDEDSDRQSEEDLEMEEGK